MNNSPITFTADDLLKSVEGRATAPSGGDRVAQFVGQYLPLAQKVSAKIGVEPQVLLGQWGLETGWGKSVIPGTNNLGNIKDFGGKGPQAVDNMTGSRDAYRQYASADAFGDDFAGLLGRRYKPAVGAGGDAQKYFSELKRGGYAEDPGYIDKGVRAASMAARHIPAGGAAAAPQAPAERAPSRRAQLADNAYVNAAPVTPERSRGALEAVNDTVIEAGNAVLGGVKAVSDFVSPGNRVSQAADQLIKDGESKQSDVVQAEKARLAAELGAAEGVGDEVIAMLGHVARSPLLVLAQTLGMLAIPGSTIKGARGAAQLLGAGRKGVAAAGTGAGVATGAALGGGDAAGTAYDLVQAIPDDVLASNPEARALLDGGMDMAAVKHKLGALAAREASVGPAVAGAAAGAVGAERVLAAGGLKGKGLQKVLGVGAVEAGTEAAEEGYTQYAARDAAQQYDPSIDPSKGVAAAATMGAVMGGATGGGVAALSSNLSDDPLAEVKAKAAESNSPLSKAAVSGAAAQPVDAPTADPVARLAELEAIAQGRPAQKVTGPDGKPVTIPAEPGRFFTEAEQQEYQALKGARDATPGAVRDEIGAKVAAIQEQVRSGGLLDALRSADAPVDTKSFLNDLATASSPSTPAHQREQALTRLEFALGWAGQQEVAQPAPVIDEVLGAHGGDAPAGARPGMPQLRAGVDRDKALQDQLAAATTEFEREQIRAQMDVNREQRMRAPASEKDPQASDATPAITPTEQARLDAAALAGKDANRRAEDDPRQAVISRALRSIEERGGVASPAEAQIVAEAGLGKPYDRIDETLAPALSEDQKLAQATGIALAKTPRSTQGQPGTEVAERAQEQNARSDSRLQRLADERDAAARARDTANAQERTAEAPAADAVIAALKAIPVLRSAEQRALVAKARAAYTPEQMRILSDAANIPANLSATDKIELEQLRKSADRTDVAGVRQAPPTAELSQRVVAPAGAGPALIRKRRAQMDKLARLGFDTVKFREGVGFLLIDSQTGNEFALDGRADAQLARAAIAAHIGRAASRADTAPTDAQKEAGNYRKGEPIKLNGVTVIIENPRGSTRSGTAPDGTRWESTMAHHYGDIARTEGADGDKIDVFIGPRPDSDRIFVVDQRNEDGSFDEHKFLFGFTSEAAARDGYLANYDNGWTGLGAISEMTQAEFKAWLKDGNTKRPVSPGFGKDNDAESERAERSARPGAEDGRATAEGRAAAAQRAAGAGSAVRGRAGEPGADAGLAAVQPGSGRVDGGDPQEPVAGRVGSPKRVARGEQPGFVVVEGRPVRRVAGLTNDPGSKKTDVLRAVAARLDRKLVFLEPGSYGDGFVFNNDPSTIHLNSESKIDALQILLHEFWHTLEATNDGAADIVRSAVARRVKDGAWLAFHKYSGQGDISQAKLEEELRADLAGIIMSDARFWGEVFDDAHAAHGAAARGIVARIAAALNQLLDRARSIFSGDQKLLSHAFVNDLQAIKDAYKQALQLYLKDAGIRPTAMQADILRAQQQLTRSTDRGDTSARGNEGTDRPLGQPGGVAGEARGADAPAASYGRPQEGSVSATGVHFGTQVRDTLSAAYYGSGLKGAERERLEGAENADIRPRIFFYVDKGNGIRPESGVGAHAHQTELRNLYDVWADPLGLRKANPGASNWERAVMQAGFDGYLSVDPKMGQGFAVLVGKQHTNVPVQPIAAPGATAPAKTEPTELREALMSRELNAIDLGNIPGATLRSGTLIVPADAREAANAELERIGSDTRFSKDRDYKLDIEREERVSGKAARLTPEEVAAVERDGDALGLDEKQIKALLVKARERKKDFPQSEGWAPLEVVGVELDTDTETGLPKPGSEHPKFKKIPYSFNVPPGAKRAPPKRDEAWLAKVADKFEALVLDVYKRAEAGDKNAQTIIAHQTWYRNVAEVLRREYGGHGDLFADLLGATSPNTPVDTNWAFSLDAMQRFLRGDFNDDLARLQKWVDEGKPVHKFPNQHKVRQASGKLYGMNSDKAMRAMLDLWRRIEPGTAPKARNFALNLIGQSNMATIDVWAARMLRRAANAVRGANLPRIPLPAEMGLTGEWNSKGTDVTGAFGFGAAAMERVSRSLKKKGIDIAPPDLQAVAWFAEKELWGSKGWTSTTGEGGSFEERIAATPVDRYIAGWSIQQGERKPSDEQMSLAQARVMAMLSGDDSVLAARAMPTAGLYAGTVERSFDTEWTALRATHDPRMAMAEIARLAAENDQWDIFVSRVVRKDEINANARPGVEIYFKDKRSLDAAMPLLEGFTSRGQDGFTMVVDPRAKGDGEFIGVRLQYVPEISARWDEDARARLLEDGGLEAELEDKAERLDDIVREVEGMDGVAHSALVMYDTVVVGKESYDEFIGSIAADADQEAGSEAWFGRPARQALEGAVARYAGQQQQDDAGRVPDAGGEFQSDDDLPNFSRDRGDRGGRDQGRGGATRADAQDGGQGRALPGYSVSPKVGSAWGPDPRIASVAEKYAADHGIDYRRQAEYINADSFDAGRAARIAEAYAAMAHAPQDPRVKAAYADLVRQTRAQYDALAEAGYKFWLFDGDTDPYAGNPWAAMRDLRDTQSMAVFATAAGFGSDAAFDAADNPLLAATGLRWPHGAPDGELRPVLVNDLFRAVHDAFGHGLEGAGFRHDGEENAWQAHVRLFTGDAVGAITTETRGQNSWLNFGPNGEKNRSAGLDDTVFADQKTGLLPAWAWTEGRAGDFSGPGANKQFGDKQAVAYNRDMVALRKQLSVLNSLKNCIGA